MATQSKTNELAGTQALAKGTNQHFPVTSTLAFGGKTYKQPEVIAAIQALMNFLLATSAAKAAYEAALQAERDQMGPLRNLMRDFRLFVIATFGNSPTVLGDFGIPPKKQRALLTVEQLALAVKKRAATRKARNTLGKKQKKAIKGTVPLSPSPAATAS